MTIEELEALLEVATRERNVETNSALMFECDWKDACRERDEARAEVERFRDWYRNAFGGPSKRETPWDPCACDECESLRRLKDELPVHPSNLTDVVSLLEDERDEVRVDAAMLEDRLSEARAEVERLTDERDELLVRVANQEAELRATREAYTNVRKLADALRTAGITADDCRAVETLYAVAGHAGSHRIVEAMRYLGAWLRALPIPEEP